jgi:hypothetical protein
MQGKSVLHGSSLDSNPDISQKYKTDDINKAVANTLYPAKKYRNIETEHCIPLYFMK